MTACASCGFEGANAGVTCPLCGASDVSAVTSETYTLAAPGPAAKASLRRETSVHVGQILAGRYRVESLVGSGGMGLVLRVTETSTGRPLALKILRSLGEDEEDRTRRFQREIEVLGRIRHAGVLRILDSGMSEAGLFFVTELLEGEDLKASIRRRGPWPPSEAARLGAAIADALAAAHERGIVHRDVKPSNVMITADGSVRLLDFGLARGVGIDIATLTRTGVIVGTPGYMAPEQFDALGVDERADVYSLGVVLFEALVGRLPFRGKTPLAVALAHKSEPPPLPRAMRRGIPAWLERVVLVCLEKDPARRYPSAAELAAELRRPHEDAARPARRLASGDLLFEDPSGLTDWALVLGAPREKVGWTPGIALRFEERFYKLEVVVPPRSPSGPWSYRFSPWPAGEVFRRLVDYDEDAAERAAAEARRRSRALSRWLGRER
jgi:serine/threonine protein kinase